ncbi:MAG: PAS domain S-box protein [Alphaproteobacteria bacterium]
MIPRRVESVAERRLLILAGTPEDAQLVKGALRKTGLSFRSKQVDSESAFARALVEFAPAIVLAGSKVPGYSARAALDHVRRTHPEIPVIVLADSLGEAAAVELVKAGAKDVVLKRDIPKDGADRLAHAILQALAWEEGRRQRKKAEEALRKSEERFRDIAEVGSDWIWETDEQHRFKLLAGESVTPTGYVAQDIAGKTRWELMGVDLSQDDHWRRHRADLDAQRPFRAFRYSMVDKSGQPLHLSISGKPIYDASGSFRGYRGTATNITPIIEALRRAEEAEALLRDAVESISEGFVIFDRDDRLVTCNEAYRRIYEDIPHLMLPGVRFEDVVRDGLQRGVHMDALGREEEWLEERLRCHRDPKGAIEQQLVGGRSFLITERRMRSGGTAGLRIDITALRQAERALRDRDEQLSSIAENLPGAIFRRLLKPDGSIALAYVSGGHREIYGIEPSALVRGELRLLDLIHPDDRATYVEGAKRSAADLTPHEIEYRIVTPNAGIRWARSVSRPWRLKDGTTVWDGVVLDITERKLAETALGASEARYRMLIEQAPEAIIVYDLGEGRFIEANRNAERLFGCDRAELQKAGPQRFYLPVQPDGRPVGETFAEHVRRAVAGETVSFERWIRNAKGVDIICEVRLALLPSPVARLIRGSFIDITARKQAEKAILDALAYNRLLIDVSPIGLITYKATGAAVSANAAAAKLVGGTVEQLNAQNFRENEAWRKSRLLEMAEEALATNSIVEKDIHGLSSFGKECWFTARHVPFTYNSEQHLLAIFTDITERRRAEESLRVNEHFLSESQRIAHIGSWRYGYGLADTWSEELYRIYGVSRATFTPDEESFLKLIHPEDRQAMQAWIAAGAAGEKPGDLDFRVVLPDGTLRFISGRSELLYDGEGKPTYLTGTAQDITERKRAETALREEEAKFRGLVEQEIAGIVIVREDGTLAYVNPEFAKMVGCTPGELIGRPLFELVPPDEQQIREKIRRQLAGEAGFLQITSRLASRKGETIDVLVNASRSVFEGRPASIAVVLDISERRRVERSLKRLNRTLRTLSAGNEALVHAANEQDLLDAMCRTLVEVGGYRAARIWMAEHDEGKTVRSVAWAGAETMNPETPEITWADVKRGWGPTGTAIRTGEAQINQDYATNPKVAPWRSAALEFGFASNMALPLKDASGVFGALTIFSAEPNSFHSEEVRLLGELSNDLSYGIAALRDRTSREEREQQLHSITENLPGIIFRRVLKPDGTMAYTYASDGFRELYGVRPSLLVGEELRFNDVIHPEDRKPYEESIKRSAEELSPLTIDFRVETPKAGMRWLRSVSRPVRQKDGTIAWDGVALDISELKGLEADRDYLSYYDQLTGLPNRTLLVDRLRQALEQARRFDTRVVVVALELSTLKDMRESSGFGTGDSSIREIARRLQGVVAGGDTIAHSGDGEFLLVLTGIPKDGDITAPLREITRRCEESLLLEGKEFAPKISMGVSVGPEDGTDPEILIRNATTALNRAKSMPRQAFQFYSAQMTESAVRRLSIEAELRRAIEQEELVLFYQPVVNARTLRIVGCEALIRWRHPERGLIPPGEFIPVAEATGLIVPLGEFALRSACAQMREWQDMGHSGIPVSVNLSGWQLLQEDLGDRILAIVQESGLSPESLKLELTESTILHNVEAATRTMEQLSEAGVRFSVDDFGIEHSALSHLSRLPIEALKIDYSFVSQMTKDSAHAALVQAIVSMTHAMGKLAVAEGVETLVQLTYLQAYQCDAIQGFLISRAVPADAFLPLLQRGALEPSEESE